MLDWFEKKAPIRTKFKVLMAVHTGVSALGVAATAMAVTRGAPTFIPIAMALASFALTVLTVLLSGKRICDPYVNTVGRMEALAAGDTSSPIAYTEYEDCVGRMTKAMTTFRDNAVLVQENAKSQDIVVTRLGSALKAMAGNRLDCEINDTFPPEYEALRHDFNQAVSALTGAISMVQQTAEAVLTGANEIHTASDDLSRRNEQQAASLEETSAAMNQVTAGVHEAAGVAVGAQQVIANAHREATEGGVVVERAVEAMAAIEKSAQEIGQIVDVIDGIAFQTNLLALNAGVEAARAGDAGKGFAVVATEVRALAQRSAEAAKNIGGLISASSGHVDAGVKLVGETGELLSKLVSRVTEINTQISGIANSSQSQAASLAQVNDAIGDLDRVTQQNAAMVEEASAATRSLADEAKVLTSVVSQFSLDRGRAAPMTAPRPKEKKYVAPTPSKPQMRGSLALKSVPDEDWSEF